MRPSARGRHDARSRRRNRSSPTSFRLAGRTADGLVFPLLETAWPHQTKRHRRRSVRSIPTRARRSRGRYRAAFQQLCHNASCWISRLGCRPDRRTFRLHVRHRTRWAYRSVHLVRICVSRPHDAGGSSKLGVNVPGVDAESVVRRLLLQMVEEVFLRRERRAGVPPHHQLTRRQYSLVLRFGDDSHKILAHHYLH